MTASVDPKTNRWRNNSTRDKALRFFVEGTEIIVFDTETSGLKASEDRIIELAAKKYVVENEELKFIGEYHQYIQPPFLISEKITELTGITNQKLSSCPMEEEVFPQIQNFFENTVVSAHNSSFDVRFMKALYERNNASFEPLDIIDTLEMARDLVLHTETENYKLGTLAKVFGLDEGIQFHNALDDVTVTALLFQIFIKEYKGEAINHYSCGNIKPAISSIGFWEGFQGFSRIYVHTDCGSFYYEIRRKTWGSKEVDINMIDMDYLEKIAFEAVGVTNIEDFSKFRGKFNRKF